MKAHKYWSISALITMLGTFYTGYKGSKEGHKYFAANPSGMMRPNPSGILATSPGFNTQS